MQTIDLFTEIGRLFPGGESVRVLAALRQDPMVWDNLQQESFLRMALQGAGSQALCWSPGRLAMLALGEARPEALIVEPLMPLNASLQEKALRAFQHVQRTGASPNELGEAGLLALALRERRRLTGTWSGILQEILPKSGQVDSAYAIWRTPLTCLYSLIPDPEEMLRELAPKTPQRVPLDWIAQILVAQPLYPQDQVQLLSRVLLRLPVNIQLGVLRSLSLHGSEDLAKNVAGRLLIGHPAFRNLRVQGTGNEPDLAYLSARALSLQQMGSFYQLAGDQDQARALYEAAEATLGQWLAGLYLQRLNLSADGLSSDRILLEGQWLSYLTSSADWLKNELGVVLVNHSNASDSVEQIAGQVENGFFQIREARERFASEPAVARDLAHQAVQKLIADIRQRGLPFIGEYILAWKPVEIVSILDDLSLSDEALNLAEAFLAARPGDIQLLDRIGKILAGQGKLDRAVRIAQNIVSLEPDQASWRRTLASLWGEMGAWDRAFDEWEKVLSLSDVHLLSDRLSCAEAAFHADRGAEAVEMSKEIIEEDQNNGSALSLLGQALSRQGKPEEAERYLVRATLLLPDHLPAWLALAQAQQDLGDSQRALETLRAAVTAIPEAPESHLALGQACLSTGLLAEALPHLKKAFHMSGNNGLAAMFYGRVLRLLGHASEARQVLEHVRNSWKTNPEIAYEYALALLDLNDADGALPVLEAALQNGLPVLDGYLLYAKILLGEYHTGKELWDTDIVLGRMLQADQALRRIMEIDPDSLEARFLMADILREKGDLEEALELYRALAELPATSAPELRWRVQWGMGRTAMRLGQTGTALAAIKEAVQAKPDSLKLQRGLAEASLRADLAEEALEAANVALQLAPDETENLAWFSDFVSRLGENRLAVEALERATQLDPHRPGLWVKLAECQMIAGDLSSARASLETLRGMDNASACELHRAGQVFMRMEDQHAALECFNRALDNNSSAPAEMIFEVAELHEKMGDIEVALELSQKALDEYPDNLPIYLFQTDLLRRLDRPQAALALLERALRIAQESQEKNAPEAMFLGEIHQRFTNLLAAKDDLAGALYHAEKALAHEPGRAALAYQAADLALALLQNERAGRILGQAISNENGSLAELLLKQGQDGLNLLCLNIEFALEHEKTENARVWIESAPAHAQGSARLLAARARLLARRNDYQAAEQVFMMASKALKKDAEENVDKRMLWYAQASLDLQHWKESLSLFEKYAQNHPGEARAHLALARALVLAAERQRLCAAVGCRAHAPGPQALDEAAQIKFDEAIRAAEQLVNSGEIGRWQARGQAVFMPSAQTTRALAAMPASAEDTAALIAALRQINNRAAAAQVAYRHGQDVNVQLQLALCYYGKQAEEGMQAAAQVVQNSPKNPLAQVILASLALQAGEINEALQGYAEALEIWPNEPEWHDAAGDLCLQADKIKQAIEHRRQAVMLDPNQAQYALKLGQICLTQEDPTEAIAHLEKATVLNPGLAEAWLALATAYHMVGRFSEAIEAAKQASELNSSSAEGMLIAGETSMAMDQIDLALEFGQNAIRREPENGAALLFLSNVWVKKGRSDVGLSILDQTGAEVKASYPVAFERARLIHQVHGPQPALEVLEILANEYPEEPGLLGYLARVQAEIGDVKSAERNAFKALRLDPDQPGLAMMLGRLQRKTGQLDQAVYLLGEVIRLMPDNLHAYLELASVYQERREFAQALEIYQQAMRIAPEDYQAFYHSGLILRDSKDYSGAEAMLRRAADMAPDNLSIRRQLVAVIALNLVHSKQEVMVQ